MEQRNVANVGCIRDVPLRHYGHAKIKGDEFQQQLDVVDLAGNAAIDVGIVKDLIDDCADARPIGLQRYERFIDQVFQRHPRPARKRMMSSAHHDKRVGPEPGRGDTRGRTSGHDRHCNVEPASAKVFEQQGGNGLTQPDFNAGMLGVEAAERGRHIHENAPVRMHADSESAAKCTLYCLDGFEGTLSGGKCAACFDQERVPGVGDLDPPCGANE
jgi:hypothetical protein